MFARFSVKKPLTVFVAVVLVVILGFVSFSNMTPDLLPSINLPYALVITSYPGATPEEVELKVSKPLEKAMASLENINNISSVSGENVSQIVLEFNESADMENVVSNIREKINGVSGGWDDMVSTPYILKINPDMLPVTVAAVNYKGMDNVDLTSFLNDELMPQLEGTTGVASVAMSGDVKRQTNVILSQEKIKKINDKIRKSIDDKFTDAEKEIADNAQKIADSKTEIDSKQSELAGAKSQLQEGQSALLDQSSQAQGQLIGQKVTLESTKSQLNSQLAGAQSNLAILVETEKKISEAKNAYDSLITNLDSVNAGIETLTQAEAGYNQLTAAKAQLEAQIAAAQGNPELLAQLQAQLDAVNGQLAAIDSSLEPFGITGAEISGKLAELNGTKAQLEAGKAEIEAQLAAMDITPSQLGEKLGEVQGNIGKIQGGIGELTATLDQLNSGSATIDTALAELNRQQLSGTMEISSGLSQIMVAESSMAGAKTQLDTAEAQLDTAKEDMVEQKDAAYSSANISITMDMINQILSAENFSMPAGYVKDSQNTDYLVRVGDKIEDEEEMKNLLLFDTGAEAAGKIYLKDVADVFVTDNSAEVYAKIDGKDGVVLSFSKQSNYATATVSENVAAKFKALSEKYEGLTFTNLSDQGDYIKIVVDSVLQNLVLGAILAILILLFFLKDIRPTAIIACSIPISLLFAIVLMYFSGITLNVISLSGLAIGVGMLVDNSVVVIENIYRMRSEGESVLKASVTGAVQVTGAIVASTLTTICVFLPIVFIEGITRQLFVDMALTIAYSLLASLIVAITLVPAMSSGMLRKSKTKEDKFFNSFLNGYEKLARLSLKHKWVVIVMSVVLLFGSTFLVLARGFTFMPDMSGQQLSVSVTAPKDSTFEEKTALADKVMAEIMTIDDIETVGAIASNAGGGMGMSMGSMMGGSGDVTLYAIIKNGAKLKDIEISQIIKEKCSDLDGEISASGAMNMGAYMSALGGSGVSITLYGNDMDDLMAEAQKVGDKLGGIDGIDKVESAIDDATPEIRITVNKEKAMLEGLTVAQVYTGVASLIKTETASSSVTQDGKDISTIIYSEENENRTTEDVKNLELSVTDKNGDKKNIKLSSIADITETKSLNSIKRDNQKRYLTVTAGLKEGYNITNVTSDVEKLFKDYTPTEGITVEVGGESTTIMEAITQLLYMLLLAVVIIYLIMVAQFQSFKSPFIVMFTIPLAFTGGFMALLMTNMELSVVSMVGFVMLAGIIVNNGIVLIDYTNRLRMEGMDKSEAIIEAGRTRMRPILMTALTTVLGLVFMAVGTGMGAEMMQPMAIVCIGGLLYATLMTLFVVPAMYDVMSRKTMKKIDIDE